jgi:hypothetical protein
VFTTDVHSKSGTGYPSSRVFAHWVIWQPLGASVRTAVGECARGFLRALSGAGRATVSTFRGRPPRATRRRRPRKGKYPLAATMPPFRPASTYVALIGPVFCQTGMTARHKAAAVLLHVRFVSCQFPKGGGAGNERAPMRRRNPLANIALGDAICGEGTRGRKSWTCAQRRCPCPVHVRFRPFQSRSVRR